MVMPVEICQKKAHRIERRGEPTDDLDAVPRVASLLERLHCAIDTVVAALLEFLWIMFVLLCCGFPMIYVPGSPASHPCVERVGSGAPEQG